MFIFQFIKYNNNTTLSHLLRYNGAGAIICFDLEDSLEDFKSKENTFRQKENARKDLINIFELLESAHEKIKFGIRTNRFNSDEFQKDLRVLRNRKINYIFLPKSESEIEISNAMKSFQTYGIFYDEIIPVIETRNSLKNLEGILKGLKGTIKKIAFGHGDYNLSIETLPFFHQYNPEYWKWVNKIIETVSKFNIAFINSPFVFLNDDEFFKKMLSHLYLLCNDNFGQITLTSNQSKLCNQYDKDSKTFPNLLKDRSDLAVTQKYAKSVIDNFENYDNSKGFAVDVENEILLTPQEYILAKKYISKTFVSKINLVFAGGCFPVQYNILFEDLFHQTLKRKMESELGKELSIKLLRYERFKNCFLKIKSHCDFKNTDILIFHIRPEPVLRIAKLYYKYLDNGGKIRRSLNIPFLKKINSEEFDIYEITRIFENSYKRKRKKNNNIFLELNYFFGYLVCNRKFAFKQYLNLIREIKTYCDKQNIRFLLLTPPGSSGTKFEEMLCKYMNRKIIKWCNENTIDFINGFTHLNEKEKYFDITGRFASQEYHDHISEKIFEKFKTT